MFAESLEARVAHLERRNARTRAVAILAVIVAATAWLVGPALNPSATADPKPPSQAFDMVKADTVAAKDIDAERLLVTKRLYLESPDKKAKITFSAINTDTGKADAAIQFDGAAIKMLIDDGGIYLSSKTTKAVLAIDYDEKRGDFRIFAKDKDGKTSFVLPPPPPKK
jgi:hypothetical protein